MPGKFSKYMPAVWAAITGLCVIFTAGAKDEPGVISELKIPATLTAVISAIAGAYKATSNTNRAANSLPEHLTDDAGELDPVAIVAELKKWAYKNDFPELDRYLSDAPLNPPTKRR